MRSSPRKLETEQEIYNSAIRALMRRAHTVHQMRSYLARRADDEDLVSRVIARLREHAYLDDARYASEFARQHAQVRRQGRFRITRELRTRGVPDRHIEMALDAAFAEGDESALVRTRLARLLARIRGPVDQRKTASVYRSLLRAGFPGDLIRTELRTALQQANDSVDAADLPPLPEPDSLTDETS
jgi:regulatory protein